MTGCIGALQWSSHAEQRQQTSQAKGTALTAAVTGKDTKASPSTRWAKAGQRGFTYGNSEAKAAQATVLCLHRGAFYILVILHS